MHNQYFRDPETGQISQVCEPLAGAMKTEFGYDCFGLHHALHLQSGALGFNGGVMFERIDPAMQYHMLWTQDQWYQHGSVNCPKTMIEINNANQAFESYLDVDDGAMQRDIQRIINNLAEYDLRSPDANFVPSPSPGVNDVVINNSPQENHIPEDHSLQNIRSDTTSSSKLLKLKTQTSSIKKSLKSCTNQTINSAHSVLKKKIQENVTQRINSAPPSMSAKSDMQDEENIFSSQTINSSQSEMAASPTLIETDSHIIHIEEIDYSNEINRVAPSELIKPKTQSIDIPLATHNAPTNAAVHIQEYSKPSQINSVHRVNSDFVSSPNLMNHPSQTTTRGYIDQIMNSVHSMSPNISAIHLQENKSINSLPSSNTVASQHKQYQHNLMNSANNVCSNNSVMHIQEDQSAQRNKQMHIIKTETGIYRIQEEPTNQSYSDHNIGQSKFFSPIIIKHNFQRTPDVYEYHNSNSAPSLNTDTSAINIQEQLSNLRTNSHHKRVSSTTRNDININSGTQEDLNSFEKNLNSIINKDIKPFTCPECFKSFASSSYLTQHKKIHLGIKRFVCNICLKKFTQLTHLQQHTRTHTGDKPYKCKEAGCDKAFSQLSNMNSHLRSHQYDKPFHCKSCYKCFSEKSSLLEHESKHNARNQLKNNSCPHCNKKYSRINNLRKHIQQKHAMKNQVTQPLIKIANNIYNANSNSFNNNPPNNNFPYNIGIAHQSDHYNQTPINTNNNIYSNPQEPSSFAGNMNYVLPPINTMSNHLNYLNRQFAFNQNEIANYLEADESAQSSFPNDIMNMAHIKFCATPASNEQVEIIVKEEIEFD